jgi:thioredoxin 1
MATSNNEITDRTFEQAVRARIPVLIDFWGDDCVPCKMMDPVLDEIKSKYQGKVAVVKANIKNCSKAVQQYSVMTVPTLILFKNGKPVEKVTGVVREKALNQLLSSNLSS